MLARREMILLLSDLSQTQQIMQNTKESSISKILWNLKLSTLS